MNNTSSHPVDLPLNIKQWTSVDTEEPDQLLRKLDALNIEWYVSDDGALFVRQWRLVASDFVSPDDVPAIMNGNNVPDAAHRLEWVSANLDELKREHSGDWVAIGDREIIYAKTLANLLEMADEKKLTNPFVTQIPNEEVVWNMAYVK